MNRGPTLADRINADVLFHGVNAHKQFMFKNGSNLVTNLFVTLEEAVARFGQRIKIDDRVLRHSTPFQNGLASTTYSPRPGADQQELHEYGSGYLKRLLSPAAAVPVPVTPEMHTNNDAQSVAIRRAASVMTSAEIDAAKAEAAKVAANHSRIIAKETAHLPPYTHEQLMSMGGRPGGHLSNTPPITQPQPLATETPPVPTVTEPPASEQPQGEEDFA